LSSKAGVFHPTEDGKHYLVFADLESRDLYLQNPERVDLLLATINTNFISEDLLKEFIGKEVSKIVADAPEDLNTLKEISDFIKSDSANAAVIIKNIDSLDRRVDTIENNSYIILSESEYEQLENKEDRLYFLYDVEEDGNI
jgi:tRNA A58 N-methylase Trm61